MVMLNSLYKLSWKWLSSITKMGEIVRTCAAPMFGFGNWWQSLWTNGCLELYLKDLSIGFACRPFVGLKVIWRRICVDQGAIQGFIQRLVMLIKTKYEEWFKLINTQSVEDVPSGIKWSHGMVSIVHYALCTNPCSMREFYVGLGMFPWACVKRKISFNPWRMTSSGDRHQDCGVQVQVEHHEEITWLKLAVHCGDNGLVKMCRRVAHP